jgi:hypothetical protein
MKQRTELHHGSLATLFNDLEGKIQSLISPPQSAKGAQYNSQGQARAKRSASPLVTATPIAVKA